MARAGSATIATGIIATTGITTTGVTITGIIASIDQVGSQAARNQSGALLGA